MSRTAGTLLEDLQNVPESLPRREPENRARTLLGRPSKCPGKLATKRTREHEDLQNVHCHKENRKTLPGPC